MGILPALVCSAAAQEPCKLTAMGTEAVAGIRDGRTLLLADGRELRLAAIEVTDRSLSALQSLVEGRDVRLKQLSRERDRYERPVAFVQQVMLKQDQARVSARIGGKACADVLLSAEQTARMSHRGQWPTPISPPCSQKILPGLRLRGGQFVLVEGKVLSVRENGATIFLGGAGLGTLSSPFRSVIGGDSPPRASIRTSWRVIHPGTRLDRTAQRSRDRGRGT